MTISLSKNQTVSLAKEAPSLTHLHIGLGWDPIKKKGFFGFGGGADSIDLDASVIVADANKNIIDEVWFRGQTFNEVDNAVCRLVDEKSGKEICRYELREKGSNTGFVMAAISREGNGWAVKALGEPTNGRTVKDLAAPALSLI